MSLDSGYFRWLCDKAGINLDPAFGQSYVKLAHILSENTFYSVVPRDIHRAKDGVRLRLDYYDICGKMPKNRDEDASFLEVLVALSMRMSDLTVDGNDGGYAVKKFFWELLRNIKIDIFDDKKWVPGSTEGYIKWVLRTVCQRIIQRDGSGGFFPLKDPKMDQRSVEIWYQMNAYLMENYSIFA